MAQGVVGVGPLVPGLGKGGHALDQVAGHANNFFELPCGVQADDHVELDAVLFVGCPSPYLADAVLGKDADRAVLVEQGRAERGVGLVIAQAPKASTAARRISRRG